MVRSNQGTGSDFPYFVFFSIHRALGFPGEDVPVDVDFEFFTDSRMVLAPGPRRKNEDCDFIDGISRSSHTNSAIVAIPIPNPTNSYPMKKIRRLHST